MIVLAAIICLRFDVLTVQCVTMPIRLERTPAECVAMIAPVEVWLREAAAGLPVVLIAAGCKRGRVV